MISQFNDGAQAWLFNPNKLAPELSGERDHSARSRSTPITRRTRRRRSTATDFKLEVGGLIDNKEPWTLEQLYALPQESQITRLICVEGWSAIG